MIKDICSDIAVGLCENSPKLMIASGIAMMLVSTVWACHKTSKSLPKVKENTDADITTIKKAREECSEEDYTKKDYQRDLAGAYGRKVIGYTKVYIGPIIVTGIGIGLIFGGEYMLLAKLASMTAAYEALDQSFRQFRERVDENFGDGTSEKIALGGKLEKQPKIDESKWKFEEEPNDMYTFTFDQDNLEWVNDRALLYDKLSNMQGALNDKMVGRLKTGANGIIERPGYLFLSEALKDLDIEPDVQGKIDIANNAGWIFDTVNPIGDNFIDIGLDNPRNASFFFEPGTSPSDMIFRRDPIDHNDLLFLNFNCDGLIGPRLNPNSRFQLDIRTKGIAQAAF